MADDLILSSRYRAEILWRQSASENAEPRTPKYTEEDRDVSQFLPITSPSSRRWHAGHGKKSSSLAIFQRPAKRVNNDQHHWFARLNDSPFWGRDFFSFDSFLIWFRLEQGKRIEEKQERKQVFLLATEPGSSQFVWLEKKIKKKIFKVFIFLFARRWGYRHLRCMNGWVRRIKDQLTIGPCSYFCFFDHFGVFHKWLNGVAAYTNDGTWIVATHTHKPGEQTWHAEAARDAQRWADQCQFLIHDNVTGRWVDDFGSCGQNIFVSTHQVPWWVIALRT